MKRALYLAFSDRSIMNRIAINADFSSLRSRNLPSRVKTWKLLHTHPISIRVRGIEFEDLQSSVDNWRQQRNKIVHGMVKSHPGKATEDIVNFLEFAKATATEGELLARAVSAWVRKSKYLTVEPVGSTERA